MVNKAEAEDCRACVAIGKVVVVTFLFPLLVVMDEEGTGGPIPGGGLGAVVAVAVFSGRAQALAARGVVVVLALLLLVVVSAISILDVVGEAHTHKRARERPKKIMQDIMVGVRRGRKKTARHGPILHPKKAGTATENKSGRSLFNNNHTKHRKTEAASKTREWSLPPPQRHGQNQVVVRPTRRIVFGQTNKKEPCIGQQTHPPPSPPFNPPFLDNIMVSEVFVPSSQC